MTSEELQLKEYWTDYSALKGDPFGVFEVLVIGNTSLSQLKSAGLVFTLPKSVDFPFRQYQPPTMGRARPDRLVIERDAAAQTVRPVAVLEHKQPRELETEQQRIKAAEQAVFYGAALGARIAAYTDQETCWYVDVNMSLETGSVALIDEHRPWMASVVADLLSESPGAPKDPTPLAEIVWQIIWHSTKAEPKEALLTFVEIFMLKFLSDNLPLDRLPRRFRFEELLREARTFEQDHGKLPIEYYVTDIRPKIKNLFPDTTIADEPGLAELFGLGTIVSKTSIVNGFAFLRSSESNLGSFNDTFIHILQEFEAFGALASVDPEFKLRLYETFLRRSARQQRLGQFFTPRNIVKPMVRMAQLHKLPDASVVLDPAAGVGGFLLEPLLFEDSLGGNLKFGSGTSVRRIKTIGIDVDKDLHILAKANALLHLTEAVRDRSTTLTALNKAMANQFILMNDNEMLGSLYNPPRDSVDVILTNPPYVTQGSHVYRTAIGAIAGDRNELNLRDYYGTAGLGVEALFLRYISGALKPGGRAFVIVPLGLLNRSQPAMKRKLLSECNILASISLPRKAFFNTPQPTYILILERRHTRVDPRPEVFCGIARSTGESLDARRVPLPNENDLDTIATAFIDWSQGHRNTAEDHINIRVEAADQFTEDDRWDVTRFWSDEELVSLDIRPPALSRTEFVEEASSELHELMSDLDGARLELEALSPKTVVSLSIDRRDFFSVVPGKRITTAEAEAHPGELPVYSCFTRASAVKAKVDARWAIRRGLRLIKGKRKPIVTVNATGATGVGLVFVRSDSCAITDDVISIEILDGVEIDPHYLAAALKSAIAGGDFQYEAKLYQRRVRSLSIEVPTDSSGNLDLDLQRRIGAAVHRVEQLQDRLVDLGRWSRAARLI